MGWAVRGSGGISVHGETEPPGKDEDHRHAPEIVHGEDLQTIKRESGPEAADRETRRRGRPKGTNSLHSRDRGVRSSRPMM